MYAYIKPLAQYYVRSRFFPISTTNHSLKGIRVHRRPTTLQYNVKYSVITNCKDSLSTPSFGQNGSKISLGGFTFLGGGGGGGGLHPQTPRDGSVLLSHDFPLNKNHTMKHCCLHVLSDCMTLYCKNGGPSRS